MADLTLTVFFKMILYEQNYVVVTVNENHAYINSANRFSVYKCIPDNQFPYISLAHK